MRILFIHSQGFEYSLKKKAIGSAEEVQDKTYKTNNSTLVTFIAVEKVNSDAIEKYISLAVREITKAAKEVKEINLIVYPWVHLTNVPAEPHIALYALKKIAQKLKEDEFNTVRAPFGYYKSFSLNCKGHPLAERSKFLIIDSTMKITEEAVSDEDLTALQTEEIKKTKFLVMTTDGAISEIEDYKFKKNEKNLKLFVQYETEKDRTAKDPPPHAELMRKLKIADYVYGSDSGNLRWLPRGWIIKKLLERQVEQYMIQYGAMVVETPLIYSYEHPSLKKYLQRFPSRQYVVRSGTKNYFMRFAACFGQFLLMSESQISYRNLPLKMFELAPSFRREQKGELAALRRLRAFTMPDIHTLTRGMEEAKKAFVEQFDLSRKVMADIDIEYETAFRVSKSFLDNNKDWITKLVKQLGKSILLECYEKRFAYYEVKFEFNYVDNQKKAAALSTVQIDVENAERFNITYVNEKGEKEHPLLLHCSISGAIEREVYAILETAYMKRQKGKIPMFPVWLSPIQVRIIPVSDNHIEKAVKLARTIIEKNIRVEVDDRDITVGKKVRQAEKLWTPYIVVVGDKESEEELSVRVRESREQLTYSMSEFVDRICKQCQDRPIIAACLPLLLSRQPLF